MDINTNTKKEDGEKLTTLEEINKLLGEACLAQKKLIKEQKLIIARLEEEMKK